MPTLKPKKYHVALLKYEDDLPKNFTDSLNWSHEIDTETSIEEAAEAAAQHAYDDWANEDIEQQWPIRFLVADELGNISRVIVSLEAQPTFWTDKLEENVAHLKQ